MSKKPREVDQAKLVLDAEVRRPTLDELDTLAVDAIALFISNDERPLRSTAAQIDWRLCGRLSGLLQRGAFSGNAGERALLPTGGRIRAERLFLFGAGPTRELEQNARGLLDDAVAVLKRAQVNSVAIAIPHASVLGYVDAQARAPLGGKLVCVFAD